MPEDPGGEQETREHVRAERAEARHDRALELKEAAEQRAAEAPTEAAAESRRREAAMHEEGARLHAAAKDLQRRHQQDQAASP